jgi:hypothetical protein
MTKQTLIDKAGSIKESCQHALHFIAEPERTEAVGCLSQPRNYWGSWMLARHKHIHISFSAGLDNHKQIKILKLKSEQYWGTNKQYKQLNLGIKFQDLSYN